VGSKPRIPGSCGSRYLQQGVVGMGSVERTRELRRRRSRKVKLAKIRARFNTVTSEADKAQLLAKAQRVSPLVTEADLAPTVATAS
jgi:hypothetical protein